MVLSSKWKFVSWSVSKEPPLKLRSPPKLTSIPFASNVRLPDASEAFPFSVRLSLNFNVPAPENSIPCAGTVNDFVNVRVLPESTERRSLSSKFRLLTVALPVLRMPWLLAAVTETLLTTTLSNSRPLPALLSFIGVVSVLTKLPPPCIFIFEAPISTACPP